MWGSLRARQGAGVAEAWAREVEGKPTVAADLRAVSEVAGRRLGEGGVRELVRGARAVQDGPGQRERAWPGSGGRWRRRTRASGRTRRSRTRRARPSGSAWGCGKGRGWGCDGLALSYYVRLKADL